MRGCTLLAVVVPVFFPGIALAAPEATPSHDEPRHGVDVVADGGAGALLSPGTSEVLALVGVAAFWRLTPRLAIGLAGARGGTSDSRTAIFNSEGTYAIGPPTLTLGGAALRYDYAVLGPLHAWVRGDAGIAFARDEYYRSSHGTYLGNVTDTRRAPFLGVTTGLEVRIATYLSIGLRGGGEHLAFGGPIGAGSDIRGPAEALFFGLDVGLHVPIE
jgi:hypothetical protein